jgi:hypothetical protein
LAPMGELCSIGGLVTTLYILRGKHSLLVRRTKEQTEGLRPLGITSPLGDKVQPWGPTSLGGKFSPLGMKLKTSLWLLAVTEKLMIPGSLHNPDNFFN